MKTNLKKKDWILPAKEKVIQLGPEQLNIEELLALIFGDGKCSERDLMLAKNLLMECDYALDHLARMDFDALQQFEGIGPAKAIKIITAFELTRRRKACAYNAEKITCSYDVYQSFQFLADKQHEEFWVLFLNRSNQVLRKMRLSTGGVSGTVVDVRMIYAKGIQLLASGIICVHNHPSGNLNPSQADKKLTKKIEEGGSLLDVNLLDHLIVSNNGYTSFADEGWIG